MAKLVAVLLPCLLIGGTEVATLETASGLRAIGYRAEVIVYFDDVDPGMLEAFRSFGVSVHLLGVRRGGGIIAMVMLAYRLCCTLHRRRYRAIWVQYMTPTLLPLVVCRLFTRNLIASVHVAASHYSSSGLARMRWLASHWCARFVCVSVTVANGVFGPEGGIQRLGGRVVVLPNALDTATVRAVAVRDWRAEMDWPVDTIVMGFAGRLARNKGADLLLTAVAQLQNRGLPVRLVVVGDGAERECLQAQVRALGISAITCFAGSLARSAIFGAIKGFDIAVVPSREEGFGLSALEAMAAGVPVVASRVDALEEVVQDGVSGLLCRADDAGALAGALACLVGDAALRQKMGAAGLARVSRLYDAPAYRARLADLLAGLGLQVRHPV